MTATQKKRLDERVETITDMYNPQTVDECTKLYRDAGEIAEAFSIPTEEHVTGIKRSITLSHYQNTHEKYGNTNAGLARVAGVTSDIVSKLMVKLYENNKEIHREKLTAKQKILFDFIFKEVM